MPINPYKRSSRVASEVFHIVSEVCRNKLSDPRVRGVQLTGAEMTDDLQILKVYYYVDGPERDKKRALHGLESAKGYLKRAIAHSLDLRVIPDIRYYFDDGIERGEKMDRILEGLNKGDEKI